MLTLVLIKPSRSLSGREEYLFPHRPNKTQYILILPKFQLQTCIPDEPCKKIRHLGTAKTLGGGSDKMFAEVMCSCPLPQQSCPSTESSQGHTGTRTKANHQYYPLLKMDPFLGPPLQPVSSYHNVATFSQNKTEKPPTSVEKCCKMQGKP